MSSLILFSSEGRVVLLFTGKGGSESTAGGGF